MNEDGERRKEKNNFRIHSKNTTNLLWEVKEHLVEVLYMHKHHQITLIKHPDDCERKLKFLL
jgi:hypothetical protein